MINVYDVHKNNFLAAIYSMNTVYSYCIRSQERTKFVYRSIKNDEKEMSSFSYCKKKKNQV